MIKREKKIPLTVSLSPSAFLQLEKESRRRLRTRANFASWLIEEGVLRARKEPRSRAIRLEMEERANADAREELQKQEEARIELEKIEADAQKDFEQAELDAQKDFERAEKTAQEDFAKAETIASETLEELSNDEEASK